jgi:hypothetical protein
VLAKGCGMASSTKNQSWLNWVGRIGWGPEIFQSVGMTLAAQSVKMFFEVFLMTWADPRFSNDLGGAQGF